MPKRPMDPFARKMLQGTFIYGGVMLVMFAVLSVVYLHTRPRCSDRVVAEAAGPGGRFAATLMERRCGEEAPFFSHINLRPAGVDLKRGFFSGRAEEGEVFLLEQDASDAGLTLEWTAPATLIIRCAACSPALTRKHEAGWKDVIIQYSPAAAVTK